MNTASVVILALFLLAFVAAVICRVRRRGGSCCGCRGDCRRCHRE